MAYLLAIMVDGELWATFSASSCTSSSKRSGSMIWLIMPICRARSASKRSKRPSSTMRMMASKGMRPIRPMGSSAEVWPTDTWGR